MTYSATNSASHATNKQSAPKKSCEPSGDLPLPHDRRAEAAVLASCFMDRGGIFRAADVLDAGDFYDEKHRAVYDAMLALARQGKPVEFVLLCNELGERLTELGGSSWLAGFISAVPTTAHLDYYAGIVRSMARRRDLLSISGEAARMAFESDDVDGTIRHVLRRIDGLSGVEATDPSGEAVLAEVLEHIEQRATQKISIEQTLGRSSGFGEYDAWCDGLQPGMVHVLGAYTGSGKTFFAVNLTANILTDGGRVAYFSTEMPAEQIMLRLLACLSGVPTRHIVRGLFTAAELEKFNAAQEVIRQGNLFIFDKIYHLEAVERWARRCTPNLVIMDFVQNMEGDTGKEYERVTQNALGLQRLAKAVNCTVFVASQLSNDSARQEQGMGDDVLGFKGSGAIAATADLACIMRRVKGSESAVEIAAKKNRHGPTGKMTLTVDWEAARMVEDVPHVTPAVKAARNANGNGRNGNGAYNKLPAEVLDTF